jgi:hypothetical protein
LTGIHNPMLAGARALACVTLTAVLLVPAVLAAAVLRRVPPWLKRAWHSGCQRPHFLVHKSAMAYVLEIAQLS